MKLNFHALLTNYVNTKPVTLKEIFFLYINKNLFFQKKANQLIDCFNALDSPNRNPGFERMEIKIENYNGQNKHVLAMINYLETFLKDDLVGAYVHGSLGTNEPINYSDFDALVIIKNEIFADKKRLTSIAEKLSYSRKLMLEFDLLQHHGWFVLSEKQLEDYPITFFPPALFSYCKSLLTNQGLQLNIKYNSSATDFKTPFLKLNDAVLKFTKNSKKIKNVHQLKSFLSEFMLLPTFYIQARDKKGIYKKFSFDEAKTDFTAEDWKIMDDVSEIRQNWEYTRLPVFLLQFQKSPYIYNWLIKRYAPSIHKSLKEKLNEEFFKKIDALTILMRKNILK